MKTTPRNFFILCLMALSILFNKELNASFTNKNIAKSNTALSASLNIQGQPLKYGDRYYIKNIFGGGTYLETCGAGKCASGTKYSVTTNAEPDRFGHNTGTWIIVSASGKGEGKDVLIGDFVYLKNVYGGGSYLETCGAGKCASSTRYNVTTNTRANANRDGHNTGKWEIVSGKGAGRGSQVRTDDFVHLKNTFGGGTYLDTCGNGACSCNTRYNVTTNTQANRGGEKTGLWTFQVANVSGSSNRINVVYSKDGVPVMKFKYKDANQTYETDCSLPSWAKGLDITTTTKVYMEIFASACHQHDLNYRAPWRLAGFQEYHGRDISDEKFRADMLNICNTTFDNFVEKNYCKTVAEVWYEAVTNHGKGPFDDGQAEAERDCDSSSIVVCR